MTPPFLLYDYLPTLGLYLPTGAVGQLCRQLQAKLLTFEAMLAKTAIRRLLCTSQALGVATTSLAAKLDIMLTEDADQALVAHTAQSMVKGGFLVCFQGLISTIGKEHGMLEDVAIAMELASLFHFELRAKRQSGHTRSPTLTPSPSPPTPTGKGSGGLSGLEEDLLLAFGSPSAPPLSPSAAAATAVAAGGGSSAGPKYGGSQGSPLALEMEFDEEKKRVRLLLEPAALDRLPPALKAALVASPDGALLVPLIALLFCQGIDAKQSIANFSNQLKGKDKGKDEGADESAAGNGTGQGSKKVGGDSTIQPIINRRSLKVLNDYCHRCHPLSTTSTTPAAPFDRFAERFESARAVMAYGSAEDFARSIDDISFLHPMLFALRDTLKRDNGSHKNVELLREQERVVLELGGGQVREEIWEGTKADDVCVRALPCTRHQPNPTHQRNPTHRPTQVIFCKSGKDRTGMAVTLHQARLLGDRHGCGAAPERLVRDANGIRLHGTRLLICDKNVGIPKYAFNKIQLQFMPDEYRPPTESIFQMMESLANRDRT